MKSDCGWRTRSNSFCQDCLVEHECGEEMALPVVNSPRMGVCGYAGESDFDNFSLE
jgi:hypothetical protein